MAVSSKKRFSQYGERVGKKLIFKAMPKRERQRVTTRRPQRKQKKKNNNNNNKTGAVYKPVITNVELQSTLSLRSMAVLSSRAQERRSREIRERSARERPEKLLPPQSLRGFSTLARLYYLARPTKTAMLRMVLVFVFFVNGLEPRAFWFIVAVSQFKDV